MFDFGTNSLITPANFEIFTGIKEANLSDDEIDRVEFSVKAVCSQIRTFCGYAFVVDDYTEVWDAQGSDVLIPSETPINNVTSIKFASDGNFANSDALDSTDFVIHPTKQFISLRYMRFPRGRGMIEVKYNAGYSTIPEDIQMAVCLQYSFMNKSKDNPGWKSIGKMNESQTMDDKISEHGMPAQVYSILKAYKKIEAPLSLMFSRTS